MDLNSRQYVVSLDMTRTGSIRESFEMRHNDDNELIIELRDSAGIIDLNASGVINATLLVTRKDKVDIPLAGTITPEGRASFKLKRASLEKQGMVEVVAQFYFANDVRISTPTLIFNVLRDPSAGAVGDEGDDRTLIEIILNDGPALLEQLQTAYDELVIQKAAFAQFQSDSETAFSNAQNQRTTDFNADQTARSTAFEEAQTQRATDFNASQGERTTLFNQAQTNRQNDYQTWKDTKDTELNQLASDTENSKLAADGATANANNAATEALEAAEEATGAVAEVTGAKQSTVKNKTFANLDARMEELESDTFIPMKNEVVNGDFRLDSNADGLADGFNQSGSSGSFSIVNNVQRFTATGTFGGINTNAPESNGADLLYIAASVKANSNLVGLRIQSPLKIVAHTGDNTFQNLSLIGVSEQLANNVRLLDSRTSDWSQVEVAYVKTINLTKTFGKGNEPTKEEMDRLLAKFPNSFFDGTVNLTPKLLDDLRYLTSDVQMPMTNEVIHTWGVSNAIQNSIVGDEITFTATSTGGYASRFITRKTGNKYYIALDVKSPTNLVAITVNSSGSDFNTSKHTGQGQYERLSAIHTAPDATSATIRVRDNRDSEFTPISAKNIMYIDLTVLFGAGNEPTKAQMDALLATYPNSWFNGTVNLAENKRIIPFLLKRLELKADKAQEAWIVPTLLNGAGDSIAVPIGFYKDTVSNVWFKGRITVVNGGVAQLTLPVGYRPKETRYFTIPLTSSATVVGRVDISSQLIIYTPGTYDLSGIAYKAEA